jgi:hypothetical protein
VAARIIGSRLHLRAPYLSGVVSGPIDADKLDYMARDSYYAGLPLGLDVLRLIKKLEIVTITPENAPNPNLRARAEKAENKRIFDVGISLAALNAFEQMIVARVLLYDRMYYHHKVRAAEAMARQLLTVSAQEGGSSYELDHLFRLISDDGIIALLAGQLKADGFPSTQQRTARLATALQNRALYHRAFGTSARFLATSVSDEIDQGRAADEQRSASWTDILDVLADSKELEALRKEIHSKAKALADNVECFSSSKGLVSIDDILIEKPIDKVTSDRSGEILTRTEDGGLNEVNLYFNPELWSEAYKSQKHVDYVFCPRAHVPVVSAACRIVFYDRFGVVNEPEADRLCKTAKLMPENWIELTRKANLCSAGCADALKERRPKLKQFRFDEIRLPPQWLGEDADLPRRLAESLNKSLPSGVVASTHRATIDGIYHLTMFLDAMEQSGEFKGQDRPDEKNRVQREMLKNLRARGVVCIEGANIAGGETDVLLPGDLIVENKVEGTPVKDPGALKPGADWQARRYSIAICRNIHFIVVAFKPDDEKALPSLPNRISIYKMDSPELRCVVRLLLPWGHGSPSGAKSPSAPK